MGNINYDSFYKFLVSLGIILLILPFATFLFLFTNTFDLQISKIDLDTYTDTAQKVIRLKQSTPLLIEKWYMWLFLVVCVIGGVILIAFGLIKWYELQKLDDICKKRESQKGMESIEKNTVDMSDEQIIQKNISTNNTSNIIMKGFMIEQRFFYWIKNTKRTHIVKTNIMIGNCEYDVVAFSNQLFDKDYVYEVKYIRKGIYLNQIEKYREAMKELQSTYSEKLNRVPYMVLAIVVPDEIYEHTLSVVEKVKKWNNYSIDVMKESDLPEK